MARYSVRYLTNRPSRSGIDRYYWQPSKDLKDAGWHLTSLGNDKQAAMAEAQRINARVDTWRQGLTSQTDTRAEDSVSRIISTYKKSRDFKLLAKTTQDGYVRYLKVIDHWCGDQPARLINAQMVQQFYDSISEKKPARAFYIMQVGRLLFAYAERHALIQKGSNPFTRPRARHRAKKGRLWQQQDIVLFAKAADQKNHAAIGTAVLLNEWIGQRMGDILELKPCAYKNGILRLQQSKTGADIVLDLNDIEPIVKARLEWQINCNARNGFDKSPIICRGDGQAYSRWYFADMVREILSQAAEAIKDKKEKQRIKDLVFKDLRHTAVTRLAEAGCTVPEIASITGHSFTSINTIIDRYNVRTLQMAKNAFAKRRQVMEA
jgi:integrase